MPDTILNVKFDGEASGVVSEADRAASSVKRFGNAAEKQTNRGAAGAKKVASAFASVGAAAAKAGAAIAATAGVAFAGLVKQGLEAGDALAKTADKLGVATDALASMRLAANQTGVATRQFDMALQRVTRRVAEAAAGTGEAQGALKVLGLEASNLIKLKPDEQLAKIADQFNRIENPAQRVQIAFKLFDAEGVGLINTLRLGSEGLDSFRQKAETLGLALSREAAANIERANDAVDLLKQGVTGLGQQLAARSAPYLEAIADQAFKSIEAMGGMQVVADRVISFLVEGFAQVANAVHGVRIVIAGLKALFQEIGRAILNIARAIDEAFTWTANKIIDGINLVIDEVFTSLRDLFAEVASFARSVAALDFLPDAMQQKAGDMAASMQAIADGFEKTGEESKVAKVQVSQFLQGALRNAEQLAQKYKEDFLDLLDSPPPGDELRRWFERVKQQAADMSNEFVSGMAEIGESADITAENVTEAFEKGAKESTTAWHDFGNELRDIFVDIFENGSKALDNFVDRVKASFKEAGLRQLFDGTLGRVFTGGAGGIAGIAQDASGGGGFGLLDGASAFGGLRSAIEGGLGGMLGGFGNIISDGIGQLSSMYSSIFGFDSAITSTLDNVFGAAMASNQAVGNAIGLQGAAAQGAGGLVTAGAGIAGGFIGNRLGESLFNRQANSSWGSSIGGIGGGLVGASSAAMGAQFGSWAGPVGALIGAAIGGLVDVIGGGDGRVRSNTGTFVGETRTPGGRFGEVMTGDSGLTFQSYTRRGNREASDSFTEALMLIDSVLTRSARAAGVDVDLSGRDNLGVIADAGHSGPGSFFGARGFNGRGSLEDQAEAFVTAWIGEVADQLPDRVRALSSGIQGSAEEMVTAFEAGIRLDQLTSVSVFDEVQKLFDVLEELSAPTETMFEIYTRLTEETFALNESFDGSAQSMADLANSLTEQKTVAYQLVAAYRAVSIEIDALLGNTIQNIRESVLTDEQIYAARREEIAALTAELETAVTPERINELVAEIDKLANQAYSLLDDSQQQALANEFIDFLSNVQAEAQERIDAGLASIEQTENDLNVAIDASVFQDAVTRFGEAVDRFNPGAGGGSNGTPQIVRVEVPGMEPFDVDLRAIPNIQPPEVGVAL